MGAIVLQSTAKRKRKIADRIGGYRPGMTTESTTMQLGESALTGWRGSLGRAVAKPIARRTRFSEEQVRAAIGLTLVAYAVYRLARPLVRTARA